MSDYPEISARFVVRQAEGIVPEKPWVASDGSVGLAAQTDGRRGPLAYFATRAEADEWVERMSRLDTEGLAPAYEHDPDSIRSAWYQKTFMSSPYGGAA